MRKFRNLTTHKGKRFLYLLLSLLLMLSMLLLACNPSTEDPDEDEPDDDEEEIAIVLPIKNGYFEDTSSTGNYPRTPTNWTFSADKLVTVSAVTNSRY